MIVQYRGTGAGLLLMSSLALSMLLAVLAVAEGGVLTRVQLPGEPRDMLTMEHPRHTDNRIGYRLHEHLPLVAGTASEHGEDAAPAPAEAELLIAEFSRRPGVLVYERAVTEEGWVPQDWTFYVAPREDGFDLLWCVRARDQGLHAFYAAQQCFRMSGATNIPWRQTVALTPAFSEYDLWARQEASGTGYTSLSYFRRGNAWEAVPPVRQRMGARTPLGRALESAGPLEEEEVLEILDPKHDGVFLEDVDNGLITRSSVDGKWICGMFWERTTHVSNHHPADCLHATVNLGPLPPHGLRAVRGRIYWNDLSRDNLLEQWKHEFPGL